MNKAMRGDRIFHLMKRERYNRATLVWLLHVLYFVTTFGDVTRLLTTFHITAPSASAFLRPIHHRPNRVPSSLFRCILTASTSTDATSLPNSELDKNESTSNGPQIQQQHYELMYVLGVNLARQLGDIRPLLASPDESEDSKQLYGMELSQVAAGIVDTIIGRIDERQQAALLQQHGSALNALIQDRALALQEKLVMAGQEMLQIMAETDGATTILPSNVVVHILNRTDDASTPNYGMRPTKSSIVKMHFHGTLADGTIFDSSYVRTKNSIDSSIEPINVPIAKLVPGLREGMVQHMKVGDTAMIGIPPASGYGLITTPPNPNIPDNSTLFYKVQLLDVLTAGIGGEQQQRRVVPTLLNADGTTLSSASASGPTLLGANGRPLI